MMRTINISFLSTIFLVTRLGLQAYSYSLPPTSHTMFPKGFIFGTATAAYQIEGAWNEDNKGPSIWDNITHSWPDFIVDGQNADVADDSYHKYREDVKLLKDIGIQMYRFSISWPRVLPNGRVDNINQAGLDYYMNLIDELLVNGIEPVVTLYHWDLPQDLQDIGGWLNPDIAQIFAEYADLMFQIFGDKVKWWITINEGSYVAQGYGDVSFAPALNMTGVGDYLAAHNLLRAHGKAYRLYQKKYSHQGGKFSMTFSGYQCFPLTNSQEDIDAAERCFQFQIGLFAHPIFKGDYPPVVRQLVDENSKAEGRTASRLPYFTPEELEEIKGSADFYGFTHYTSRLVKNGLTGTSPSMARDMRAELIVDPNWTGSAVSWLQVVPQGFRSQSIKVKEEYGNPIVIVTEIGYPDDGSKPTDDPGRISYYESYFAELRRAIYEDKCNVIGLLSWSLMDNFEWRDGYTAKFGLVSVDMDSPNRTRTMKNSAYWLQHYIAMHTLL